MISSPTSRAAYTLSSTTETLPVPFYFLENSHLRVIKTVDGVDTQLFIGTHFTATGAGVLAGGSITLTGTGVAVGNTITIKRLVPLTQLVDYVNNSRFPADTHEKALDKLTMICQWLGDEVLRSLRFQEGEAPILPLSLNDRKGKGLMFDATTGAVEFYDVQDILDAADAAAASAAAAQVAQASAQASAAAAASYHAKIEVATVAALKALSTEFFNSGDVALVRGYYAARDGGEQFREWDPTATPDGYSIIAPNSGEGGWRLLFSGPRINVRVMGAKGDGIVNDTAAIQAAIDFAASGALTKTAFIPSGNYLVSGLTTSVVSLEGESPSRSISATLSSDLGSRLIHIAGAAADMIRLTDGNGWERVQNLTLQGKQNQNRKTSIAITGATTRRIFTIATSDVPLAPSNVAVFPFYGLCIFFDADGRRLGTGIVQTVNSGTGEVTLASGWDNYAAPSGTSGLLTAACRVVFSPRLTYTTTTGVTFTDVSDSCGAGYNGIVIAGRSKVIRNVYIRDFHCGIVIQDGVAQMDQIWTNNTAMAGIAVRNLGQMADLLLSKIFLQGYAADDMGQSASSVAVDYPQYRTALCGLWGVGSKSEYADVTSDQHIHGMIDYGGTVARFGLLLIDKPLKEAIISIQGIDGGGVVDPSIFINTLSVHTVGQDQTTPALITYPSGYRSVVALTGSPGRRLIIDILSVQRFSDTASAADDFSHISNITTAGSPWTNELIIGQLSFSYGASALYRGVRPPRSKSPFGYIPAIADPVQIQTKRQIIGSDDALLAGLSDSSTKRFQQCLFNYILSDPVFVIINALATSTENLLIIGGGDGARQAATEIAFRLSASKATGDGNAVMTLKGAGNVGIGTASPNAAALLDLNSTTRGFLLPRMTTSQRDLIASPPNGLVIYNTTLNKFQGVESGSWVSFT